MHNPLQTTMWCQIGWVLPIFCFSACSREPDTVVAAVTPAPLTCDAGDDAFITRVMPIILGRKPHGAAEIRAWSAIASQYGRESVIAAMLQDSNYVDWWRDWLLDAMAVPRYGERTDSSCYGSPLLDEDRGALARYLSENPATAGAYALEFNMADVVESAIEGDNLSVAYRANLFARLNRTVDGANVGEYELESNRRKIYGDEFFQYYLNRNLTCMTCHNSQYSTTGNDDPALDRTWEIPGLFEKALLGSSFGIEEDTAYAVFKYRDMVDDSHATEHPWGLSDQCGTYAPESALVEDFLDHEAYFIDSLGESGSIWQVEAYLMQGVQELAAQGLTVASDGTVDGPAAAAWLLGATIADRVWEQATGSQLTIAHHFPRNQGQRDRLWTLTQTLVESAFSLRALLVEVVLDPYFNQGSPASCLASPYGMDPIFNPWSVSDSNPDARGNGPGDQVHRHSARTLLHNVHDALGWAHPTTFLAVGDPMLQLELDLGAWMRVSQPGFNGVDFQGSLSFENMYGACQPPETGGAGDGCGETPGFAGCASCTCQSCVCAADPYCCDVQWDGLCVSMCNESCGGCGGGLATTGPDTINRLLEAAKAVDASVSDVVSALKDRLIGRSTLSEDEKAAIEALLGVSLTTKVSEALELEPSLRGFCGALLMSPDFMLALDPGPAGDIPPLTLDQDQDCQQIVNLVATQGITVSCVGGQIQ